MIESVLEVRFQVFIVELNRTIWSTSWQNQQCAVRPAKTQISLGICQVWSESSLCPWRKLGSLATHWTHIEDSDQTGRMPRLMWVFAVRIATLLVLSCRGSYILYFCSWNSYGVPLLDSVLSGMRSNVLSKCKISEVIGTKSIFWHYYHIWGCVRVFLFIILY